MVLVSDVPSLSNLTEEEQIALAIALSLGDGAAPEHESSEPAASSQRQPPTSSSTAATRVGGPAPGAHQPRAGAAIQRFVTPGALSDRHDIETPGGQCNAVR